VGKIDDYARALGGLDEREPYLLEHSGLPGPRGNIELGLAAAQVCEPAQLRRWASLDARAAPTGGAEEFLASCGVVGLGRRLVEGDAGALAELDAHANDARWRVREAVAMALQHWGASDFDALAAAMADWARGSWLERRAAAAALCEAVLLTDLRRVQAVLTVLEEATAGVTTAGRDERRSDESRRFARGWATAGASLSRPLRRRAARRSRRW
jgi:hypothetical protein